jgi:subtilisin family serine protease
MTCGFIWPRIVRGSNNIMKATLHLIKTAAITFFCLALTSTLVAAEKSRVFVEFAPGAKAAAKNAIARAGGVVHFEFDDLNAVATTLPSAALPALSKNPNVVTIEEDPPRYLLSGTEYVPYGIDMVQATAVWDANSNGVIDAGAPTGAGIKVGVIDSGVFTGHQDFAGVTITGEPSGWDSDGLGHGTHVCGTIAASLNGVGVVGVSPGKVSIHMVKVFGSDGSWIYSSTLIDAANKCKAAGCKIISMSLGGGTRSAFEDRGFKNLYSAGVLNVAAAGNDGNTKTSYPAGYDSVISVAAIDSSKLLATFSQRNKDVELAAPGVGVLSTVPYIDTDTVTVSGTNYSGNYLEGGARGSATGTLIDGGIGDVIDPAWSGKVVLIQRGTISFLDKVNNVQSGGGIACVIYNNAPGNFTGTMGTGNSSSIPAISLSQADGQTLQGAVGQSATVSSSITQNVSGYAYYDGTSMATPHVSGVAALIWSGAPTKSVAKVRTALQATAEDLGAPGRDTSYGYGLVRAKLALDYLKTH